MRNTSNQLVNLAIFFSIVLCVFPNTVDSIRCGICSSGAAGGGWSQLKSQFPNLSKFPTCGSDEPPLALECPQDYQSGCLTQTRVKQVVKLCSNIPVQDCKSANGVEYCYCRGELCNIGGQLPPPVPVPMPTPAAKPIPTPPTPTHRFLDDEDDIVGEGSGGGVVKNQSPPKSASPTTKPTKNTPSQQSSNDANNLNHCNNLTSLVIFYLLLYISQTLLAQC